MVSVIETIRNEMVAAMKSKQDIRRDILKLIMSETKTQEIRQSKQLTDEQVLKIMAKVVENNCESLKLLPQDDPRHTKLSEENAVLASFMPAAASTEEIFVILIELDAIKTAKSDGQATGEAIKLLKSKKVSFDSKVVSEIVKQLRNPS